MQKRMCGYYYLHSTHVYVKFLASANEVSYQGIMQDLGI